MADRASYVASTTVREDSSMWIVWVPGRRHLPAAQETLLAHGGEDCSSLWAHATGSSVGSVVANERLAARVLVLSPERRVLLMRFRFPWREEDMWITPGGSLREGESAREAARRELREETGLEVTRLGPELWAREHDLTGFGVPIVQRERYFLVRVGAFEPRADALEEGEEKDWFRGFRWWPVDELPLVGEEFAPRGLGKLVRRLLQEGPPDEPFAVPV